MAVDYTNTLLSDVKPGIHPAAQAAIDEHFTKTQKAIAARWGNELYVTRADQVSVGNSAYEFFIVKPTSNYQEAIGITKEIVVVLSNYSNLEARTLDAYDEVLKLINQDSRIEKICYVLISKFSNIQNSLREFLSNQESQVIVPFSYGDFESPHFQSYTIRNRFRDCFHSRDLFDYSDPLKKDFYFFGRSELVMSIISKHRSNLNTGIFGLRKTGKTSIIYDVIRKLPESEAIGVLIDCQNPSFNMRKWNQALYYTIAQVASTAGISIDDLTEDSFTYTHASDLFMKYMSRIHATTNRSILLLFDEIENITFGKSPSSHWREEIDFVLFWEAIRSSFQHSQKRIFTYCILGTNAKCIEDPTILGSDNPIFNAFSPQYIPGFQVDQTREMVRKLGRLMGMKFETEVYTHLNEDYGGHPFLIRRVCSQLSKQYPNRPVTIDRTKYNNAKAQFNRDNDYFSMLLEVLVQFYPDEYEMLLLLAKGDMENFNFYANADRGYVKHLLGYGIIREVDGAYDFQIDSIKEYLLTKISTLEIAKKPEEKWKALCVARNNLEQDLRILVKDIIRTAHAPVSSAKDYIVAKIYGGKAKYSTYSYNDLFDSKISTIFLKNLQVLICSDWVYFSDYFEPQDMFCRAMDILNNEGRYDAHASIPSEDEMIIIKSSIQLIQNGIDKYNN